MNLQSSERTHFRRPCIIHSMFKKKVHRSKLDRSRAISTMTTVYHFGISQSEGRHCNWAMNTKRACKSDKRVVYNASSPSFYTVHASTMWREKTSGFVTCAFRVDVEVLVDRSLTVEVEDDDDHPKMMFDLQG